MGLGRLGGLPLRKAGQLTVSREACLSRVVGLSGAGMRDTPAAALLGGGGCPRVLVCVWGWHAVGVLGQCALVAWPVWGS